MSIVQLKPYRWIGLNLATILQQINLLIPYMLHEAFQLGKILNKLKQGQIYLIIHPWIQLLLQLRGNIVGPAP